jgi:hypothetical protein
VIQKKIEMDFLADSHCTINQSIMQSPVSNTTNTTNSASIVEVNIPLFNGLAAMNRSYGEEVIRACAAHFNFDAEIAIGKFIKPRDLAKAARIPKEKKASNAPKSEKPSVSAIPLPWTGQVRTGFCTGLRLNHGLHTQCTMLPTKDASYCKTCQKQVDTNANGKPTYGCVDDRQHMPLTEYRDPNGKQSVPYATVMQKLNITKIDAQNEAAKIGITIPEELFEQRKLTRGRPKKDASASDTDSSQGSQDSVKKVRGRPKKTKKAVQAENGDDLISALVAKANSATVPDVCRNLTIDVTIADNSPSAEHDTAVPVTTIVDTAALKYKKTKATEKRANKKLKEEEEARKLKEEEEAHKLKEEEEARKLKEEEEARKLKEENASVASSAATSVTSTPTAPPTHVNKVTRLGKVYLEQDGFLFDIDTKQSVGFWNEETNEIEECDYSDDEE